MDTVSLVQSAASKGHRDPGVKSRGQSAADKDQQEVLLVAR